jgi:peptidoglycan/LPS O-acetylase OafA/YrhL
LQLKNPRFKTNNLDLLRLLFAGTVCLVHASSLSGFDELKIITSILSSKVAIKAFFIVSGFLIFMSFERSSSISSFAGKRLRRIYPAYFTIIIVSALCLFLLSSENPNGYFSLAWLKYIFSNLTFLNFLQPSLPGVFGSNNLMAVNGALWTLKIEVMFYISVPFFVFLFRKFSHFPVIIAIYCLSILYSDLLTTAAIQNNSNFYAQLSRQLPGQLSYFLSGALLYYFFHLFESRVTFYLLTAILILVINQFYPITLLEPLALSVVVIFFGLFLYVGNFGKYGDFSYGVYIIHFPIIQVFLNYGWLHDKPWHFLITIVAITIAGAFVMWHLVEKRFLTRRSHYIATTIEQPKN